MSLKPLFALLACITAAGALGAGGCQRPLTAMCRQECACKQCTDYDMEQCEAKVEKAAEDASKCSSEFQRFVDCLDDNLSCENGGIARTDKCKTEEKVLTACTKKGNPFKSVCEEAQEKTNACFGGGSSGSGSEIECSGVVKCQSQCIVDATCEELLGQVNTQKFNDCINTCGFGSSSGGGFDG